MGMLPVCSPLSFNSFSLETFFNKFFSPSFPGKHNFVGLKIISSPVMVRILVKTTTNSSMQRSLACVALIDQHS